MPGAAAGDSRQAAPRARCVNICVDDKHNEFCNRFQVGNYDEEAAHVLRCHFLERKRTARMMQHRRVAVTLKTVKRLRLTAVGY